MAIGIGLIELPFFSFRYGPSLPEGHWGHAIAYYSYYPYPAYMLIGGAHPHHKPNGPHKLGPPEEDEHSRTTYIYYQGN